MTTSNKPYVQKGTPVELPLKQRLTQDGEVIQTVERANTVFYEQPPMWKTPWNHDTDAEARLTSLVCADPSKTQQQFAKDADINNILAKFMQTGELSVTGQAQYMDVDEEFDLQSRMVTGYQVQQAWDALPVEARAILRTPQKLTEYVDHCLETGDLEPLRQLGLANALPPTDTVVAPPSAPASTPVAGSSNAAPAASTAAPAAD